VDENTCDGETFGTFSCWLHFVSNYNYILDGLQSRFGTFGGLTYYLPELFPVTIRGLGIGFTYNAGRIITAFGPFIFAFLLKSGVSALMIVQFVAIVPILGVVLMLLNVAFETKDMDIDDEETDRRPLLRN
jgi:hypothetical protein